jgi:hypothetical protein
MSLFSVIHSWKGGTSGATAVAIATHIVLDAHAGLVVCSAIFESPYSVEDYIFLLFVFSRMEENVLRDKNKPPDHKSGDELLDDVRDL